ncbi:MAG: hypothetical protein NC084_12120 [Bacteroides sp.]|nr:hypothetical protein [Eubacterium sp.]MCM1463439.1 hypothetical protein [Bacteroides sp.]
MAQLKTMYEPQSNTPETSLRGALAADGTSVTVLDSSVLPDAPNLLTIGADTTTAETVLMTAKNGNTLTITRGQDGTTPRAWAAGDVIGRYFTAYDQRALQENVETLNEKKIEKPAAPVAGNLVAFDGTTGAIKDSGKKAADFAAASHTHDGYVEKPASPVSGNLAAFDGTTGAIKDSGKKPGDFAAASHTHDGYVEKPASPVSGNLAAFDGTTGAIKDSGKKAADFAAASHEHSGYAQIKVFQNVAVAASLWVNSSTYSGYPYAAAISCSGVTADFVPDVTFNVNEAASGTFAPVALAGSGTVTIYASEKPTGTITLPSIKCEKAV